jgi:hypothetical protein
MQPICCGSVGTRVKRASRKLDAGKIPMPTDQWWRKSARRDRREGANLGLVQA